jgi:glycosidase
MITWYDNAIFYQFYPMGLTGAPKNNSWDWKNVWNGAPQSVNRLEKTIREGGWIDHLKRLGVNAVYFSPVFQSEKHGYDTRDYYTIDSRLGSNEDFAQLCDQLHKNDIKVVLDGVFNHVGRGFWAFLDVQKNKQKSVYKDWFYIDWNRNSNDNDGFWYEGWEGHFDLVKLNLKNPEVVKHLFGAIKKWIELFNIDGIRLDVAYSLSDDFLRQLRSFVHKISDQIVLIGEIIYANDMNRISDDELHSCTNYECYKALWSSCNDINMFEIAHSLNRFFSEGGLFTGKKLMSFLDNHDVSRIASQLKNSAHLPLVYGLLFGMPGVPSIYYGSEWAIEGKKENGDDCLRPTLKYPKWNSLTDFIAKLAYLRREQIVLQNGGYKQLMVTNGQFIFERTANEDCNVDANCGKQSIIICVNLESHEYIAHPNGHSSDGGYGNFDGLFGKYKNLFTGEVAQYTGSICLPPVSVLYLKTQA